MSAISDALQGARHTAQTITWLDDQGNVKDLTGATVTARIEPQAGGTVRAADGAFSLVGGGTTGQFTWTYGQADVGTVGRFNVQFKATFAGDSFDLSRKIEWRVLEAV
jgi:hypothetical protein